MTETAPYAAAWSIASPSSPAAPAHRRAMCDRFAAEGPRWPSSTSTRPPGRVAAAVGGIFVRTDVTSPTRWKPCTPRWPAAWADRRLLQQRRHQPARRRLHPRHGLDAWERVQRVNLTSVYLCCKHALPHLLARARVDHQHGVLRGRHGRGDEPGQLHRLQGVSWRCRASWACSSPARACGSTRCAPPGQHAAAPGALRQGSRARRPAPRAHPMGRFGEASEIAAAAAFLASDDSSFMTASTFLVDGGISGPTHAPVSGGAG